MGLETGTYISDLVITNPVGATDPKSQGDNHIRLLKSTIKATFPNITGAVTATQANLNLLTGASVTGGGSVFALSVSPTFTGTIGAAAITATGTVAANLFSGSGASLTALNASNLASGTVPDARFPATLPALSGVNLTALNATNLASGTVADARLSAQVALLNASTAFTVNQAITKAAGPTRLDITSTDATYAAILLKTNATSRGFIGADSGGTLMTGAVAGDLVLRAESGGLFFSGDAGTTAHFRLSSAGALTTPNASAAEVGYKGVPQNSQSVDYTALLTDASKNLHQTGASKTFTIPANGSVAYPIGTVLNFSVDNATGVSIAITTDTLRLAGTATTGTRTLAQYGVATALKIAATTWLISGAGLT